MTSPKPANPRPSSDAAASPQVPDGPLWRDDNLANPHAASDKATRVRGMFAAIAPSYDLNNRVHSLWLDQAWRRFAVRHAQVRPGDRVLDVACGTGDLTQAFARRSPASQVLGVDFTPQMLDVARVKQRTQPADTAAKLSYMEGDAMALDLPSASFDVVSIAFGIRNVQHPSRALAEFFRVLRPGGRLIILEFDAPRFLPARWLNSWYCAKVMPRTATLISGDRSGAYRYLPASVGAFMPREELVKLMGAAGFAKATARSLTMGICACYRAYVPT
jgi:demethylmenaquinone methyltransferase/2-methoxy-6-polyprenyl-1,4-benzoquinol methylase